MSYGKLFLTKRDYHLHKIVALLPLSQREHFSPADVSQWLKVNPWTRRTLGREGVGWAPTVWATQFIFSRVEYKERIILFLVCIILHRLPCGTSYFIDTSLCVADYYAALISDQFNFNIANTACFRTSSKIPKCWKYWSSHGNYRAWACSAISRDWSVIIKRDHIPWMQFAENLDVQHLRHSHKAVGGRMQGLSRWWGSSLRDYVVHLRTAKRHGLMFFFLFSLSAVPYCITRMLPIGGRF